MKRRTRRLKKIQYLDSIRLSPTKIPNRCPPIGKIALLEKSKINKLLARRIPSLRTRILPAKSYLLVSHRKSGQFAGN